MKLLVHCCCAPCSVMCVSSLKNEDSHTECELFWYNPNIHPYTEYKARRDSLSLFAANENLKLTMPDEYGLRVFLQAVFPEIKETRQIQGRCKKCYSMRLEKTAAAAAEKKFDAFTTTLLISPYQNHDEIRRIAEELAAKYGVDFLYRDFRPLFREGQAQARARGFYMQKYCGCIFSEEERYAKREAE
ncbi:MAG: epoxyqueuosine reductase QueH [Treponema sp.]|nr:epoxyqueuosine reductase QueH [Treponema sp.]